MAELHPTRVSRRSTCLTYALDRVGLTDSYKKVEEIPFEKFIRFKPNLVKVGTIVAWQNDVQQELFATSIIEIDGYPAIISNIEKTAYHVGVIEVITKDNIIVSDCILNNNPRCFPEIRLRSFNILDGANNHIRMPNFIINL